MTPDRGNLRPRGRTLTAYRGDQRRSRARTALAVPVVVAIGLALRFGVAGPVGDLTGGVLYALLVFLVVAFIARRWRAPLVGIIALGICTAVELLQLTGLPARLAEQVPPAALVLGTGFAGADLVAYLAGAALGVALDRVLQTLRSPGSAPGAG